MILFLPLRISTVSEITEIQTKTMDLTLIREFVFIHQYMSNKKKLSLAKTTHKLRLKLDSEF